MKFDFNDLSKALDGVSKITVHGGLASKITALVIVTVIALVILAFAPHNFFTYIIAAGILIIVLPAIQRLINLADRNPQAALFDGAEYLLHEQIVHFSKTERQLTNEDKKPVQPEKIEGDLANSQIAAQPDQETIRLEQDFIGGDKS